ncbi:MAG: glycosyltransferase family 39 protein [Alphaproteobacteria bacterium]|nr:glycosyltransferase family 39 protein [Alphaproteobacteria bacterium]
MNAPSATAGRLALPIFLFAAAAVTGWRFLVLSASPLNLSFDEAQYWLWSLSPDWGYYSKPPFVAWSIALAQGVCGEGEACIRMPSSVAYAIGSVFVFLAARHQWGNQVAFWSGLAFLTLPGVAYSSMLVTTDPPLLMFWAMALYAVVRAQDSDRPIGWWALLGVAMGLGLLSKYAMILFALSLALYLGFTSQARQQAGWRGPALAGLLALLLYLPNFFWNAANGFASYLHTKDNANLAGPLFHPEKMAEFVGSQFAVFGPLLFASLLVFLILVKTSAKDARLRLLAFLTLPILLLMIVESLLSRANANWAAPSYVAGSVLVTAWLAQKNRLGLVRLSVVLHMTLATLVYNYEQALSLLGLPLDAKTDIAKRLKGWPEAGARVAELLGQHPGAVLMSDDRKLMASLSYYARPRSLAAVKWNPTGRVRDTFDLNASFKGNSESQLVFVTERETIPEIAQSFDAADALGLIRQPIHPGYSIDMHVFLLTGYKGR